MVIGQPKHKDCANFKDGKCLLYGVTVPPDGPACPNFTPRTPVAVPASPAAPGTPQTYPLPRWGYGLGRGRGLGLGLGLRLRRRHRHGRRHWF